MRQSSTERLYSHRWQMVRASYLRSHPLCAGYRIAPGEHHLAAAQVVDHVVPHRGDRGLFWDAANWQPLCVNCHNRKTVEQDGGFGRPKRNQK